MSGDNSEEKSLPPTRQKLRKQREKGNVVTSKETLASAVVIISLAYLYLRRESLAELMTSLLILDANDASGERSFWLSLQDKGVIVWQIALLVVAPLFALIITLSIFLGMVVAGGPLFAPEVLAPKFEKINPAAGIKKVFGRRAIVTFLMHVLRFALLSTVFAVVLFAGWSALIRSPLCGYPCVIEGLQSATEPLMLAAIVLMITIALADYLVQRSEFMREQKMSVTEFKRELKDRDGDPHLKGKLQADQREMVESPTGAGLATIVIEAPNGLAYGIRYVEHETPAPLVVARASDSAGIARIMKASDAPSVIEADLIDLLFGKGVGDYITDEETIDLLAPHLQRAISHQSR